MIPDWMYEKLAQEYVLDETNQAFMRHANPWALRGIVEKLAEAAERGLWEHPTRRSWQRCSRCISRWRVSWRSDDGARIQ